MGILLVYDVTDESSFNSKFIFMLILVVQFSEFIGISGWCYYTYNRDIWNLEELPLLYGVFYPPMVDCLNFPFLLIVGELISSCIQTSGIGYVT